MRQGKLSEMHSYIDFATAGQDAFARVSFLTDLVGGMQTQSSQLADFSISYAKVRDIYCRPRRHQGTYTPCLSGWVPSTFGS
jgi:hypothetical protein